MAHSALGRCRPLRSITLPASHLTTRKHMARRTEPYAEDGWFSALATARSHVKKSPSGVGGSPPLMDYSFATPLGGYVSSGDDREAHGHWSGGLEPGARVVRDLVPKCFCAMPGFWTASVASGADVAERATFEGPEPIRQIGSGAASSFLALPSLPFFLLPPLPVVFPLSPSSPSSSPSSPSSSSSSACASSSSCHSSSSSSSYSSMVPLIVFVLRLQGAFGPREAKWRVQKAGSVKDRSRMKAVRILRRRAHFLQKRRQIWRFRQRFRRIRATLGRARAAWGRHRSIVA